MNKLPTQVKQCTWLVKIESTLGHRLTLDLLHSQNLNLKKDHHLSPYNIF
jgi:hypothetical protein